MSYFIIIRGPAGIGKTTISRILAEKINAEVVHFDKIMDKLGLDYILGEKWIPLDKFLKADKIMVPELKEKLKVKNLVIDGNFYHKKQIEDLIKNLKLQHFVFTLKADLKECIKRDKSREGNLGEKAIKDVFKLVNEFDYGIIINTSNKTPEQVVKEILSYVEAKTAV